MKPLATRMSPRRWCGSPLVCWSIAWASCSRLIIFRWTARRPRSAEPCGCDMLRSSAGSRGGCRALPAAQVDRPALEHLLAGDQVQLLVVGDGGVHVGWPDADPLAHPHRALGRE